MLLAWENHAPPGEESSASSARTLSRRGVGGQGNEHGLSPGIESQPPTPNPWGSAFPTGKERVRLWMTSEGPILKRLHQLGVERGKAAECCSALPVLRPLPDGSPLHAGPLPTDSVLDPRSPNAGSMSPGSCSSNSPAVEGNSLHSSPSLFLTASHPRPSQPVFSLSGH